MQPETTFAIDDTVCSGEVPLAKLKDVCNKFNVIRAFIIAELFIVFTAMVCATVALVLCVSSLDHIKRTLLLVAVACAGVASLCAIVALAVFFLMPNSRD